jgi:hypothetical protein
VASEGGKWGYIDVTGKFVIAPQFDLAFPFFDGFLDMKGGVFLGYRNLQNALEGNAEWIIPQ